MKTTCSKCGKPVRGIFYCDNCADNPYDVIAKITQQNKELKGKHIDFAVYLTGHDQETIEQMYNDWNKHNSKQ